MTEKTRTSESLNDQQIEEVFDKLWDQLVPVSGKCNTEAGEIIRAFGRLNYRFFNDGDRLDVGYGRETCNPAGRYLTEHSRADERVNAVLCAMWGCWNDSRYEEHLVSLRRALLDMMDENIDVFFNLTEDMWDYREEDDYDWDEEDEWDY